MGNALYKQTDEKGKALANIMKTYLKHNWRLSSGAGIPALSSKENFLECYRIVTNDSFTQCLTISHGEYRNILLKQMAK